MLKRFASLAESGVGVACTDPLVGMNLERELATITAGKENEGVQKRKVADLEQ